jgi:tRNA threonylcarbamoyladenosine biosynthesis protein TsaB
VKVLAIETAFDYTGVALHTEVGVSSIRLADPQRHVDRLVPLAKALLSWSSLAARDIDLIAVDVGPGYYSGLRVGVATAKVLAFALGKPIVGLTSLEITASECSTDADFLICMLPAKRREVFVQAFKAASKPGDVPEPVSEPVAGGPEDALEAVFRRIGTDGERACPVVACGAASLEHEKMLEASGVRVVDRPCWPSAKTAALLAASERFAARRSEADAVSPIYLRQPDAKARYSFLGGLVGPEGRAPGGD